MKKLLLIMLCMPLFLACSNELEDDIKDENMDDRTYILDIVKQGMVVYEPTLGKGTIMYVERNPENGYEPYIKVLFENMQVILFDAYGELNYYELHWRIQPSKQVENWK